LEIGRSIHAQNLRFAWDDQAALYDLLVELAYKTEGAPPYDGECISGSFQNLSAEYALITMQQRDAATSERFRIATILTWRDWATSMVTATFPTFAISTLASTLCPITLRMDGLEVVSHIFSFQMYCFKLRFLDRWVCAISKG
jgi:hypothetical protein